MNTKTTQKRAVVFVRANEKIRFGMRDRLLENASVAHQGAECQEAAKQLDAVIVRGYEEHGGAARLDKRRQLRLLLDELRALRDVDYVIVTSYDRLTRSAADFAQIRFELDLAGAELVIAHEVAQRKEVLA